MPTSPTVGDYLNLSNWSYNNRVIGTAATAPVGWVAVAAVITHPLAKVAGV